MIRPSPHSHLRLKIVLSEQNRLKSFSTLCEYRFQPPAETIGESHRLLVEQGTQTQTVMYSCQIRRPLAYLDGEVSSNNILFLASWRPSSTWTAKPAKHRYVACQRRNEQFTFLSLWQVTAHKPHRTLGTVLYLWWECSLLVRGGGWLVDFYFIYLFYFDPPHVNHLLMLFLKYE